MFSKIALLVLIAVAADAALNKKQRVQHTEMLNQIAGLEAQIK